MRFFAGSGSGFDEYGSETLERNNVLLAAHTGNGEHLGYLYAVVGTSYEFSSVKGGGSVKNNIFISA